MAEAIRAEGAAKVLQEFTVSRRSAMAEILFRARERGAQTKDDDLALDQAFGVLWCRILFEHAKSGADGNSGASISPAAAAVPGCFDNPGAPAGPTTSRTWGSAATRPPGKSFADMDSLYVDSSAAPPLNRR